MGFKEIWRDPVWSKVISAAIIAIAAVVGTFLLALFSQPVSTGLAHGWTYVAADAMVPRWLLGLLILSALATAVWIAIITSYSGGGTWTKSTASRTYVDSARLVILSWT
jgi:hypothetical protein